MKRLSYLLFSILCLLTIGVHNVWGSEETITIDYDSFSSHTSSYSDQSWSASTSINRTSISGSGTVYFASKQTYIQFRNDHPGIRNTTALPGAIKSIAIKRQATGSNRSVNLYVGTTALNNSNYTSKGTSMGSKTVTTDGVTWFFTPAQIASEYTYFYLYGSSNAVYLDEIVITFDNGDDYDYELVTDASTLSAGDILVFANTANTAVATTFNTSNYLEKASVSISGTTLTTSAAMEFTLGGSSGSWTLTNGMNTLRATSTTALAMGGSSGVQTWTISISNNDATVAPSASYQSGTIRYNTGSPRFKNYTSGQTAIQIYKKLPCSPIDVTSGSAVILPKGSTTYSTGDWGKAGAPTSYAAEQTLPIGSNHYCVSFTQAYENNQANGLQCKANDGVVSISDITSSYGVDIEIVCSGTNGFKVELTGSPTSPLTGQTGTALSPVTISTTSTTATLTISKNTSNVGYIKYIVITPKDAPSCADPTALTKGSISLSDRTAQVQPINWTSAAGKVDICYSTNSSTPDATPGSGYTVISGVTGSTSTSNTYNLNITSLAANDYYVWARSVCDESTKSSWVAITGSYFTIPGYSLALTSDPASSGTFSKSPDISTVVPYRQVAITASPNAGYNFDSWEVSGTGSTLSSTSSNPTTFTMGTANATVTATFTAKPLVSIALAEDAVSVYKDEIKYIDVTYNPSDVLTKGFSTTTTPSYCKIDTYASYMKMKVTGGRAGADISVERTETVTIQATADNTKTTSISVTVKPLPSVTFEDLVQNKTDFTNWGTDGVVSSTVTSGVVTHTKPTPTHNDVSAPVGGNTCETTHLHLVGWIRSDYSKVANYLDGTTTTVPDDDDIEGAGNDASGHAYYYEAGDDIDLEEQNGKTFYAVWSKIE